MAVDLGWSADTRRVAAAWCGLDGIVRWGCPPVAGHTELVRWLVEWAAATANPAHVRLGLDIPLSAPTTGSYRPVELELKRLGLYPLPSHRAGPVGAALGARLAATGAFRPEQLVEVFPFAVYRVLDWLRHGHGSLSALAERRTPGPGWREALRRHRHAKYKHAAGEARRAALAGLADMLQDPALAWRLPLPLPRPGDLPLDRLTDIYDALLALVPLWLGARGHPWARMLGGPGEQILVLLPP